MRNGRARFPLGASEDRVDCRSPGPVSSTSHETRGFVLATAPRPVPLQIVNFGSLLFIEHGRILRSSR